MSIVDRRKLLSEIALYILEELAVRGGKVKAKYLRSYRALRFWAGDKTAEEVLKRLIEANYIKIENNYIVLIRPISTRRSLKQIESMAISVAKSLHEG
ncbi:MAG: hypothetical protein QXP98_09510 [Thermoproteus sp.]